MKKLLPLFLCFIASASFAQNTTPIPVDARFKGLDTAFQRALTTLHAAGFAVAVVEKNKVIYAKGFGYRDYAKKLPVTPNTLFAIGSCTKAFTASLIGKLQADGKLDIDKPVTTILPSLKFYNDEMNNNITLRDMMTHRTGLSRHDLSWYLFNTSSRDSVLQRVQFQEPAAALRQVYQYNNFMFTAQGAVVEKITGKTWEQNVKEKFFDQLGMVTSNTSIEALEKSKEPSIGYWVNNDSVITKSDYYHIDAMGPAGSINSSVNEMANWVITWINDGKFKGKEIIPSAYRTQAISAQMVSGAALPSKEKPDLHMSSYGFAWSMSSYKGHYRVEHGGNIDGFSANTTFFPTDSIGIIVLSNQDGSKIPSLIRNLIVDRLFKVPYYDWISDMKQADLKAKAASKAVPPEVVKSYPANHNFEQFSGIYYNPGYGNLRVYAEKDSLFATAGTHKLWLRHSTYDIFSIYVVEKSTPIDTTGVFPFKFQFQMDVSGEISGISAAIEAGIKPIIFTKGLDVKPVDVKNLQKYLGDYQLPGVVVKVYLKDNKTLYALVPGQPDYELVPIGNDKFGLKVLKDYYLQFEVGADGKVTSATFIQPEGSFKAPRK